MNVVHIATAHQPFDTRIFHKEARSLSEAGHDVTIVEHHEEDVVRDEIEIAALGTYETRRERMTNVVAAYRRASSIDADVYHFHDPELLPIGVALSLTTDAKVIYDVHEDFDNQIKFKDWIPELIKPLVEHSIVPIQSLCARRFDAVVAANEWIAADFEERGHEVTTVGNFPMTNEVTIADVTDEVDHEYILSFVGNIDDTHGLLDMIDVTERLRDRGYDVGLWVIGPVNDPLERQAEERIAAADLDSHVRLFGHVDYEQMFSYLAASDVGLMLVDQDLYEHGLSNKMFEYMYAELPVVANATVSTRKYIPDDVGRHVEDGSDREAQTDAIASILDLSQEERDEMGARGRKHVLENCSWEQEAEKLVALYDSL